MLVAALLIMIRCGVQTLKNRTIRLYHHRLLLQICRRARILTSLRFGHLHRRHHLLVLLSRSCRLIECSCDGFLHPRRRIRYACLACRRSEHLVIRGIEDLLATLMTTMAMAMIYGLACTRNEGCDGKCLLRLLGSNYLLLLLILLLYLVDLFYLLLLAYGCDCPRQMIYQASVGRSRLLLVSHCQRIMISLTISICICNCVSVANRCSSLSLLQLNLLLLLIVAFNAYLLLWHSVVLLLLLVRKCSDRIWIRPIVIDGTRRAYLALTRAFV